MANSPSDEIGAMGMRSPVFGIEEPVSPTAKTDEYNLKKRTAIYSGGLGGQLFCYKIYRNCPFYAPRIRDRDGNHMTLAQDGSPGAFGSAK